MKQSYVVPINDDEFSLTQSKCFECGLHVFRFIHSNGRYGSARVGVSGPKESDEVREQGQSAKTADWLVDNDVIWPVLRNSACANPRNLKIDRCMADERDREMRNYKDLQDCCSLKKK